MKSQIVAIVLALTGPGGLLANAAKADDSAAPPVKRVLFFTKSSGWEHMVIRDPAVTGRPMNRSGGNVVPGLAFHVLTEIGAKDNIEFTFSKDGSLFNEAYLAKFDAYWFYTTGDLTKVGTDGNPAMSPEGKKALLKEIEMGKGFIGTHSASDSFHSPGGADKAAAPRFHADGDNADEYIKMLGGEFINHGSQQFSHLIVADSKFPGVVALAPDNKIFEEWYSLKNFSNDLHVLLVQDTSGMTGNLYARPNYPSTWVHMYGKGRVFYTNLGHRDDMWNSAMYQALLTGAVNWAVGRVDTDVTPNIGTAAPGANVRPVYPDPSGAK
jgi:type 1 glutamine amidotransferase